MADILAHNSAHGNAHSFDGYYSSNNRCPKTFDIIYAMTGGGPGYASETLNIMAFKYSFEYFRMGQASVVLIILFLLVLAMSLLIVRMRKSLEL